MFYLPGSRPNLSQNYVLRKVTVDVEIVNQADCRRTFSRVPAKEPSATSNFERALAIFAELKMPRERDAVLAELDKTDAA
jgi:hypothetical protein